eukprot:scaffold183119_cov18-Tisochrysis_lutea.AAC.1
MNWATGQMCMCCKHGTCMQHLTRVLVILLDMCSFMDTPAAGHYDGRYQEKNVSYLNYCHYTLPITWYSPNSSVLLTGLFTPKGFSSSTWQTSVQQHGPPALFSGWFLAQANICN